MVPWSTASWPLHLSIYGWIIPVGVVNKTVPGTSLYSQDYYLADSQDMVTLLSIVHPITADNERAVSIFQKTSLGPMKEMLSPLAGPDNNNLTGRWCSVSTSRCMV